MKFLRFNLITLTIIIVSSFSVTENLSVCSKTNVNWMTFEEAVEASKTAKAEGKTPKKIFIDIYTDWCGWCKKMDKNTFQHPKIATYLNEHFYPVKFNAEQKADVEYAGKPFKFIDKGRRGYHQLAAGLLKGKMSYPSVIFMNEDLELIQKVSGYQDVSRFDMIIRYLGEDTYLDTTWEDFQKQYKAKN